jgi:DNA-binding transcriptional regulator GbsR (MarR family)
MSVQESQGGTQEGTIQAVSNEKGNFTQVPNEVIEILMNRKKADLTSREYSIMFFLIRELQGWAYEYKPIEIAQFVEGTGMEKPHVISALNILVDQRAFVTKMKLPGFRTPLYGFNKEIFGRVLATPEPKRFFSAGNSKVINLMTFKVLNSLPLEVIDQMTEKQRRAALKAAARASASTASPDKYQLEQIHEFVASLKPQSRYRWKGIINRVLTEYPDDEFLLWCAIELVNKTRQDLFGNPIKRSIIGLFEGDWQVMRVAMQAKLTKMEAEAAKLKKKADNERRLQEIREEQVSPGLTAIEKDVDISKLDPIFQRFAKKGTLNG